MLFNSLEFILFFITAVIVHFITPQRWRWILLLGGSYFFYMCWKAEYAILILASTIITYACTLYIEKNESQKKKKQGLLGILLFNLGLLFTFKYFNFFSEIIADLTEVFGAEPNTLTIKLLLPVGISFYTFQIIGYSLDVYWGKIKAERHFGIFALYVVFFPQLVAGPIEKSTNLLPQFRKQQHFTFENLTSGLKLMLWGFFKKLVIADRLSDFINPIYKTPDDYNALWLGLATVLFAFQVFCDFSGYTDIAIGCARVLGFDLMSNFRRPYFATSVTEIWRRWHISLSDWINTYLYTPIVLALRNHGKRGIIIALIITFSLVGLWHGAKWTFVVFGLLQGLALTYEILTKKKRKKIFNKLPHGLAQIFGILSTFIFWCFTLVLFRASSMSDASTIFQKLIEFEISGFSTLIQSLPKIAIASILLMQLIQYFNEYKTELTTVESKIYWPIQCLAYLLIIVVIGFYGSYHGEQEFIYFQF